MSQTLARWNQLPADDAAGEILPCCGSRAWAQGIAALRPLPDAATLFDSSDKIWQTLDASDWLQAFNTHPRIGDRSAPREASKRSGHWSSQEQSEAAEAADSVKQRLVDGNQAYERKFGRTFIICATGKSAADILRHLHRRLDNDAAAELLVAAEEQRQITQLRL